MTRNVLGESAQGGRDPRPAIIVQSDAECAHRIDVYDSSRLNLCSEIVPVQAVSGDLSMCLFHVRRQRKSSTRHHDFSLSSLLMSAAMGDLSWSWSRVRLLNEMPSVPSNRTRTVYAPFGLSLRMAPNDATRLGYALLGHLDKLNGRVG